MTNDLNNISALQLSGYHIRLNELHKLNNEHHETDAQCMYNIELIATKILPYRLKRLFYSAGVLSVSSSYILGKRMTDIYLL